MCNLGDVTIIKTGTKPDAIVEEKTNFEYINAGTTNSGYCSDSNYPGDVVTTPSRGQGGIGFVGYQTNPFWLGPLCYGIIAKDKTRLSSRYLYHYLCANNGLILKCKNEGGVPAVNLCDLLMIKISLPTSEIQKKIADTLDNFDAICSDLKIGLPAEIEARKKQYEYYRDFLLDFDSRSQTVNVERE